MGDAVKVFLLTLSALFPIVDPIAGSPLFLAMTQDYAPQTRRALAWRVSLNSLVLMVGSYFVGAHVLNFFGVSLPVVQVGALWRWVGVSCSRRMKAPKQRAETCSARMLFTAHSIP